MFAYTAVSDGMGGIDRNKSGFSYAQNVSGSIGGLNIYYNTESLTTPVSAFSTLWNGLGNAVTNHATLQQEEDVLQNLAINAIGAGGFAFDQVVTNVPGNFYVNVAAGDLTQTQTLTIGGASTFTTSAPGASITLTQANNLTGAVSLFANGDASLVNNMATKLGASTVGGNLSVTASVPGGTLTVSGDVSVAGSVTLMADNFAFSGGAIDPTNVSVIVGQKGRSQRRKRGDRRHGGRQQHPCWVYCGYSDHRQ